MFVLCIYGNNKNMFKLSNLIERGRTFQKCFLPQCINNRKMVPRHHYKKCDYNKNIFTIRKTRINI